jgi:hypothetical protein
MLTSSLSILRNQSDPTIIQKYNTCTLSILLAGFLFAPQAYSQWTNHYPKLDDFGPHTYLEQHELPIGDVRTPRMQERFDKARALLRDMVESK